MARSCAIGEWIAQDAERRWRVEDEIVPQRENERTNGDDDDDFVSVAFASTGSLS